MHIFEFFLYLLYFIFKIYSLSDNSYTFSSSGSKLRKCINENLQNISCNLVKTKKDYSFKNFFQSVNSLKTYKQFLVKLLVTLTILAIKVAFTYNFLISNFMYVNIFNKNVDLASIFSDKFYIFKLSYYVLFTFFSYNITSYVINRYNTYKLSKKFSSEITTYNNQITIGRNFNNLNVTIPNLALYQNILITGSIGTGKTSGAISNILDELISKDIYGLVIDIKGNYVETVEKICRKYNKSEKLKILSLDNDFQYNPLNKPNIPAHELAYNIVKVITLTSKKNNSDSFWLDKAQNMIQDYITLMRCYLTNINFKELHQLVINKEYLLSVIEDIKKKILNNEFCDSELFNINSAISNIKNEYLAIDERTISIIKSEITRITNIFVSDYNLFNKFCSIGDVLDFSNENIVVISLGIGKNELLTKLISTYIKLDFQKQILSSINFKSTFFICDEYQEIANAEDAHFFSISREFQCINVISMQSYSSLLNILNDENACKVIIQNLVNKIWLRNDDVYTVSEIIKHIGKEIKNKKTMEISENSDNSRYSMFFNKFKSNKSGLSQSYSVSENIEYMFSEEYFTRTLKNFEAVCLLGDNDTINLYDKVILKRWREVEYEEKV